MRNCAKRIVLVLAACFFVNIAFFGFIVSAPRTACAAITIEAEPELQNIVGDLYALSVAMRLYYDDTHNAQHPAIEQLARYLKQPLPLNWFQDYRTAELNGDWWIGRKVPAYSRARKFMRANAAALGLYDKESMSAWLGGSFVWHKAVPFDRKNKQLKPEETSAIRVMQGEGKDIQHLFFNMPGTEYYWWSDLLYTADAHAAALKKFGKNKLAEAEVKGGFIIPAPPAEISEDISASPVSLPARFSVEKTEEETSSGIAVGDVLISPIPRTRSTD